MPIGTAFHARTAALCTSLDYRHWAGYFAVSTYETHHEHEYNAIRHGCALIDICPLFKYHVHGPDAARLVDRVITRDVGRMGVGQVFYTPWCDERGQVIDDGTVTRVEEQLFRWTAADPSLRWLVEQSVGLAVQVEDVSGEVAALALQGPMASQLLRALGVVAVDSLRYFHAASVRIADVPVSITRTGYTGDLGYELWMPWSRALAVWDAIVSRGAAFNLLPAGMLALDVARVEAGLLLIDVDFHGSRRALTAAQACSPYELGLGRLVNLEKRAFVGRSALVDEHRRGHVRQIVGLEVDWNAVERIYEAAGLPPTVPATTSRVAVPVYRRGVQVGRATSTTWSPSLKKLIALALIERPHFAVQSKLEMEITVEGVRHRAPATVVPTPFFNPARKTR